MRKQLDPRIATLIRNNVELNHRSFFVLVGDHGRDQVVNLHFLLSQSRTTARPNVLWCYKKDLGFTTHRKKREAKIKRDIKRGTREKGDASDPFELFVSVTDIRYAYYKDTPKILGRTFGMLVLQDFEAITPNLLARTIETVEGGGVVVLLLKTMTSLRQLYSVAMDAHAKYRSSFDPSDPVARFNERFLLSLCSTPDCLVLDDELNVLPVSKGKDVQPLEDKKGESSRSELRSQKIHQQELKKLREELGETKVVADVIKHAKTLDQGRAILTILDVLASSSLSTTVALTAARGRGKSAALGLCVAASIAHGYSNIFITSPSPENLKTLFEFVFRGLEALGYEEVADWSLQKGTGEWKDIILRVNVFRGHRQTIQYISPEDSQVLGQAELVVIDEAAAIPLATVRKLMGPYLVFLSSTINGYEGTGRSLSLKLIQQLRENSSGASAVQNDHTDSSTVSTRNLKEISLTEPIRYSSGDKIESWLTKLLCLDASLAPLSSNDPVAHPSKCDLFLVNRDALFSFHPASESFLQRMMALYVSSHYKNSPNDLQLMSDAPGHRLFVLLAPIATTASSLPEPLCVVQVALEGNIGRQSILNSLSRGQREAGDLIPWVMSQQYQDADFATLSGARIVRIAVHPHHAHEGYGSRALECLRAYFGGELYDADAAARAQEANALVDSFESAIDREDSQEVSVRDASRMPALLQRLAERKPEQLDWLGVSYGLTTSLFKFWKQSGFIPLHLRQLPNEITGEYNIVQIRGIESESPSWLAAFAHDFARRFLSLLSFKFRKFTAISALSILQSAASTRGTGGKMTREERLAGQGPLTITELRTIFSPWDMKRLEAYGNNMIDYTVILDLLPSLAGLYFTRRLYLPRNSALGDDADVPDEEMSEVQLAALQSTMLLALGLQHKDPSEVATELGIASVQALALFGKAVRRLVTSLRRVERQQIAQDMQGDPGHQAQTLWKPITQNIHDELNLEGKRVLEQQLAPSDPVQQALLDNIDVSQYAIDDAHGTHDWSDAERLVRQGDKSNGVVSVKASTDSGKRKDETEVIQPKTNRHDKKSSKKRKL